LRLRAVAMAKILIVEDEVNSAQALELYLSDRGHRVRGAADAGEAIAAARELEPDLLLTDVLLVGDRDGLAVARELRAADPDLPVVVMSGLPEHEVRERASGIELFAICPKPLRLREIGATVEAALSRRTA